MVYLIVSSGKPGEQPMIEVYATRTEAEASIEPGNPLEKIVIEIEDDPQSPNTATLPFNFAPSFDLGGRSVYGPVPTKFPFDRIAAVVTQDVYLNPAHCPLRAKSDQITALP